MLIFRNFTGSRLQMFLKLLRYLLGKIIFAKVWLILSLTHLVILSLNYFNILFYSLGKSCNLIFLQYMFIREGSLVSLFHFKVDPGSWVPRVVSYVPRLLFYITFLPFTQNCRSTLKQVSSFTTFKHVFNVLSNNILELFRAWIYFGN